MLNKLQEIFSRNQDLTRIVGWSLAILGILAAIFMAYTLVVTNTSDTYIDEASGEKVYTQITGGIKSEGTEIIGMQPVQDAGLNVEAYKYARLKMMEFFKYAYPKVEKISYKKNSVKVEDGIYKFKLTSSQGHNFDCELSGATSQQYKIKIIEGGAVVLDYDSKAIQTQTRDISTLANNYLPHTFTVEDKEATFSYIRRTQKYEISINNCGDEKVKNIALKEAQDWLKDLNYDPKDIRISIPDMCDGES